MKKLKFYFLKIQRPKEYLNFYFFIVGSEEDSKQLCQCIPNWVYMVEIGANRLKDKKKKKWRCCFCLQLVEIQLIKLYGVWDVMTRMAFQVDWKITLLPLFKFSTVILSM